MTRRIHGLFLALTLITFLVAVTASATRADAPSLRINELLVGNASTTLDPDYVNYSAWIELYNSGPSPINLVGYSMTDDLARPALWKIPKGVTIPAGSYVLIWADGEKGKHHTGLDLDMDGGEIGLFNPSGALVDSVVYGEQSPDVAYGREPADGAEWLFFDRPTPNAANDTAGLAAPATAEPPVVSLPGGIYEGSQSVEISAVEPEATIRYTLDGSRPTSASPAYSGPIELTATTVLRARTFVDGLLDSATATHTYLLDIPVHLPVISIATDPAHLWDDQIGIYVVGKNGAPGCNNITANWEQPWERPASMEMYETDGALAVRQDVGFEIFGNCSRGAPRKSLEIKARKLYGDNDIDYRFFSDKPLTSFRRIILRNSGQDNNLTLFRDALAQQLVAGRMDIDRSAYRPAVLYLNGVYWGIYNIREKMDEDFVRNTYRLDEDAFDMLSNAGFPMAGDDVAWKNFSKFIRKSNLGSAATYAQLGTMMDIEAFMDYLIVELYSANTDWPRNNSRYWRERVPDGRWRWVLVDFDAAFGGASASRYDLDMIRYATSAGPGKTVTRQVLGSPHFRGAFAQRFAAHLNTTYAPDRVIAIINDMQAGISPEMPAHIARWGRPETMARWEERVQVMRDFAARRPAHMRAHLNRYLGKPGTVELTLNVEGDGRVQVAAVEVPDGYSGPHFRAVPIRLRAAPLDGARFVGWQETGQTTPEITVSLSAATTMTAVFEAAPDNP